MENLTQEELLAKESQLTEAEKALEEERLDLEKERLSIEKKSQDLESKEKDVLKKESDLILKEQKIGEGQNPKNEVEEGASLKEDLSSALAQKNRWRDKFLDKEKESSEREKALLEELELAKKSGQSGASAPTSPQSSSGWQDKIDFTVNHPELNREEREAIIAIAKGKEVSFEEALSSDLGKITLDAIREKRRKENAPTEPKSRSPFAEKFGEKMTDDEHKARYPEMVSEILRQRKGSLTKSI